MLNPLAQTNLRNDPHHSSHTARVVGGTIGAFDLFHVGHLRFLTAARQRCSYLKVGIGSDRLLPLSKGRAPVCSEAHRMEIVLGLRCVDDACIFDVGLDQTDAAARWLIDWGVNTVFVSSDWIDTSRWQRLAPLLANSGIACQALPYTQGISSTALRQKMAQGGQ
ncbi:MAG: adenylyltransferase/cytidyltransferase family protein [Burkholderiaceae bacterium]|nr:adenylyltransferase/cytidyltransferase family protein [Burkholderiaceae bacterium]